uniref:Polyketide synthase n=1 Tax=Ganoderma boninense TaxID=34458 RepID=A0A5K1K8J6_9APHY|nr:Polyketide synthase [Ganoderma boninense]
MFGKLAPVAAFLAFAMQPVLGMAVAPRSALDVFVPQITYPTEGVVWTSGETQNVTWDISNAPVNITNGKGLIILRKSGVTTPVILQNGFDILLGSIEVTVPLVVEAADYSIIRSYLLSRIHLCMWLM